MAVKQKNQHVNSIAEKTIQKRLSDKSFYLLLASVFVISCITYAVTNWHMITQAYSITPNTAYEEPAKKKPDYKAELGAMLEKPESEINLTRAHFLIAAEVFPDLNVDVEEQRIERLAKYIRMAVVENKHLFAKYPERYRSEYKEYLISMLIGAITVDMKIKYTGGKLDNKKPELLFINGLLNSKAGTCITMNSLYVILAEKLGWPIHGVVGFDHMFCRWDDKDYKANIEATDSGGIQSDEGYIEKLGIQDQLQNTVYLKSLTKKQMIGQFLYARAMHYKAVGREQSAMADMTIALKLVGNDPQMAKFYSQLINEFKIDAEPERVEGDVASFYQPNIADKLNMPTKVDTDPLTPRPGVSYAPRPVIQPQAPNPNINRNGGHR